MPELPEVENVILSLKDKVKDKTITTCVVFNQKIIRKPMSASDFATNIKGEKIIAVEREGKYIVFRTTNYYLICHLAMTGALLYIKPEQSLPNKYAKHSHVALQLNNQDILYYCDIRKFGGLRLLTPAEYFNFLPIQTLGPDPFDEHAEELFKFNLTQNDIKDKTIKEALMDQSVISGIGNIYACEGLFSANINPQRTVNTLSNIEADNLLKVTRSILSDSISKGGSSISDYMNADGVKGTFQNFLRVYGKKQCPNCGGAISKKKIAERTTHYCNSCQK